MTKGSVSIAWMQTNIFTGSWWDLSWPHSSQEFYLFSWGKKDDTLLGCFTLCCDFRNVTPVLSMYLLQLSIPSYLSHGTVLSQAQQHLRLSQYEKEDEKHYYNPM